MTLIEEQTPNAEFDGPFVGRAVVPAMTGEVTPTNFEMPPLQYWNDGEYETTLVAFTMPEGIGGSIASAYGNSGFKRARLLLQDVTHLQPGEAWENQKKRPVLAMLDTQGDATLYDTRKRGVTGYSLRHDDAAERYVRTPGKKPTSGDDQLVSIVGGTQILFGWTRKLEKHERGMPSQGEPGPAYQTYDQMLDAIDPRRSASRRRDIGRQATGNAIVRRAA